MGNFLGVSHVLEVTETDDPSFKLLPLSRSWRLFSDMKDRERKTAVLIAKGTRVKDIAAELGVSEKTVDNTRASVLEKACVVPASGLNQVNGFECRTTALQISDYDCQSLTPISVSLLHPWTRCDSRSDHRFRAL